MGKQNYSSTMSQTKPSQTEQCPACDGESIDDSVEEFDGVCLECGYVVNNNANVTPPDWTTETTTKPPGKKDWLSVCRVQNATEQRIVRAFAEIETISDRLGLPVELRQETAEIYCDAFRTQRLSASELLYYRWSKTTQFCLQHGK